MHYYGTRQFIGYTMHSLLLKIKKIRLNLIGMHSLK